MALRTGSKVGLGKTAILVSAVLGVTCVAGCVQTVKPQPGYLTGGPQNVVSSNPDRDSKASAEADRQLQAAQWTVLERNGPKPVRSFKVEGQEHQASGPATRPSIADLPVQEVDLPDGNMRLIWQLRNFGGTTVTSSRDAATSRRNVTVKAPDLTPLVQVLTSQIGPKGSVLPLPDENTVVVTCQKDQKAAIIDLLSKLDVPPEQVEITAKIFEVSEGFDFQTGANVLAKHLDGNSAQSAWSTFNSQRASAAAAGGTPFEGSVVRLLQLAGKSGISIDASFQVLQDEGLIKVVSSPRMTVALGHTGYLLAGQEMPIQTTSIVNNTLQMGTQYKPVGVQLYITPQAAGRQRVKLHTISIVSSVTGFAPLPALNGRNPDQMLVNPIIESREAETAVTVKDGDTLVISGLRMMRTLTRENKIPILGDIPVLEWLFKNERSQQQTTDLYFFVTPTLLGPMAEAK